MATRKLTNQEGREVVGTDIPFRVIGDASMTLELDDGAQVRVRPIVFNVVKTDEKSPDGERLYLIQSITQALLVKPAKEDEK